MIEHLARELAEVLPWGEYGRTVVPWGFPYGLKIEDITVGAILIRAGVDSSVEYDYESSPDTGRVAVDVLMEPGTDSAFLPEMYERQIAIEQALESLRALAIPRPPAPAHVTQTFAGWFLESTPPTLAELQAANGSRPDNLLVFDIPALSAAARAALADGMLMYTLLPADWAPVRCSATTIYGTHAAVLVDTVLVEGVPYGIFSWPPRGLLPFIAENAIVLTVTRG